MKRTPMLICLLALLTACGQKINSSSTPGELTSAEILEESAQEVMDSLIDELDEAGGENYIQGGELTYEVLPADVIAENFNLPAQLDAEEESNLCRRAVKEQCSGALQERSFDYCKLRKSELTGNVTLSHDSEENCQESYEAGKVVLNEVGDQVTRDVSIQRIGPQGGIMTVSGSATFEKLESGYKINKDKFRVFSKEGQEKFNFHVVAEGLEVNKLKRVGRRIHNGNITVTHNLAGFTGSHTFNDLYWENACCYPTTGSVSIELTGSREKSGTITFSQACGLASAEIDGEVKEIKLKNCKL